MTSEQSMKRCPTCQRPYEDDSMRFCLQDGSLLLSDASASQSFDPGATLQLPGSATGRDEPPPTMVLGSQTLPASQPAQTAAPQPPRATVRDAPEGFAPPPPSTPKSQSTGLVVGLTVTVIALLLALGSVGAWMMLRDDKRVETNERPSSGGNQNGNAPSANSNGRADASTAAASPGST